ncbi:MAG: DUF4276 family protein, partial [Saprospiraceae bacterium]|nr:DUF4276 family protein [Saprospiraceae bacterium]
ADGTSDRALMNVIDWTLQDLLPMVSVSRQFADLGSLIKPPPLDRLDLRIQKAVDLYPCDILFVHRDCEGRTKKDFIERLQEIALAVEKGNVSNRTVSIVPIRMMEAWLLFDPQAIKLAAGNKNYRPPISLPKHKDLENLSNPKQMLHHLLKRSEWKKKDGELSKFNVQQASLFSIRIY